jgi:hypothetical protein
MKFPQEYNMEQCPFYRRLQHTHKKSSNKKPQKNGIIFVGHREISPGNVSIV